MPKLADPEVNAKRQSAAYMTAIDRLRRTDDGTSEAEMDRLALLAVEHAVYGHDAKRGRDGKFIEQGIGSKGHETSNHFSSIRRWQGKEEWEIAVREIWKRDPKRAAAIGLPKLQEKVA